MIHFAKSLHEVAEKNGVDVEDVESFSEHVSITALIPFDVAPADFIEESIASSNSGKKKIFKKRYIVTNVKKPNQHEIMTFLK